MSGPAAADPRMAACARRHLDRSLVWSFVWLAAAVVVLWPALDPWWLPLCYLLGVGPGVYCGRRMRSGGRSLMRRGLAALAGAGGLQAVAVLLAVWFGAAVAAAAIVALYGALEAGAPEGALARTFAGALSWERPWFAVMMTYFLLSSALFGLADGVWIGRIADETGEAPWKALPGGRSWRKEADRYRGRRRDWLLGEAEPRQ